MVKGKLNFTLQNVKTKRNTNMNMNMNTNINIGNNTETKSNMKMNMKWIIPKEQPNLNINVNKGDYIWESEDNINRLKLKYFPKDAFIITVSDNITTDYSSILFNAIKYIKNTSNNNVYLLLCGEIDINSKINLTSDWIKNIKVNKKYILSYLRFSDILVSIVANNNNENIKNLKEYLLCNKPILCKRSKVTEELLGKNYYGLFDNNSNKNKEINDIQIILKYYLLNNEKTIYDVGILTTYDWCNTGNRYFRSLQENNLKCDILKLLPHSPYFNYNDSIFRMIPHRSYLPYYGNMKIVDTPCYYFEVTDSKISKLLETFINKCKYIYLHAETFIMLKDINFFNKFIIAGGAGHPLRRKPKEFCNIFNPIVDKTLLHSPDLLNLNTKNEVLVYYGVDHKHLYNFKKTTDKLVIGHFSSNPKTKGSDIINECINNIINKYPNKFENFFKKSINFNNREQHVKSWEQNIKRYRNCDIYIETCKPVLNKYGYYIEYNNTKFGEWGNTCLEAAASGCIVITNSLTKDYYLQEYKYEYPLLVANNKSEILKHLETINNMTNDEIDSLKLKFLDWVKNVHSLKNTGKRFIDKLLNNLETQIYPSYKKFSDLLFKFNTNTNNLISLVYLTNKDNIIEFNVSNVNSKIKIIFSTVDVSLIRSFDILTLINFNKKTHFKTNNLFDSCNIDQIDNSYKIRLKLKPFSSNMLIYLCFNGASNDTINLINKSFNNLFLRSINTSCTFLNELGNEVINENGMNYIFEKPHFKYLHKNIPNNLNSEEEKKIYLIDKYILDNV